MILERFCNIFSAIKQTSHKASGAEEKELPRKIFSCGNPARLLPLGGGILLPCRRSPVDRGTPGDGFGILADEKAAPRLFWEFSRPLTKHGEHDRERRKRRRTA